MLVSLKSVAALTIGLTSFAVADFGVVANAVATPTIQSSNGPQLGPGFENNPAARSQTGSQAEWGANGSASIADDNRIAETSQPLPPAPSAPLRFLPNSPNEATYTQAAESEMNQYNGPQPDDATNRFSDNAAQAGNGFSFSDSAPSGNIEQNELRGSDDSNADGVMLPPATPNRPSSQPLQPQRMDSSSSRQGNRPWETQTQTQSQPPQQPQSFQPQQQQQQQPPQAFHATQPQSMQFQSQPSLPAAQPPQYQQQSQQHQPFRAQPTDSTISDPSVRPTTFNQLPAAPAPQTELAIQLIERYLVDNAPDPLPGQPTKLVDLIRQPIASNRRPAMVSQYWETWYDWSTMLSRAEYVNWLNGISASSGPSDSALLNAAKGSAANQLLAAEIQLGKSQSKLLDYMPMQTTIPGNNRPMLPLPSDQPLIKKYNTNYDLFQSYGRIPARLRGVDAMLPKTLELICQRAETVELAYAAAEAARNGLANRQSDLRTVLEAGRLWRTAEQDLIASVTSYNQAIADYSLSVADPSQSPETLVAMLISKPQTLSANPVQPGFGNGGQQPTALTQGGYRQNGYNQGGLNQTSNQSGGFTSSQAAFNPNQGAPSQFSATPTAPLQTRSANADFGQPNNQFGR